MIYTVTFNPAVDYVVHTGKMQTGVVNRSLSEEIFFGGKGINVSVILARLGVASKALGFVAGFTGDAIENAVRAEGVDTDFVHLDKGFSRINVKIKSADETELNGQGPDIPEEKLNELLSKLMQAGEGDTVVLAGSIPPSLPDDIYERILEMLDGRGVKVVVDATKALLLNTLRYKPYLIKPNNFELGELWGVEIKSVEEVIKYANMLREEGAVNVLVSMAQDGAVLVDENGQVHICGACRGSVKNSVGAGDSMLAGFIAGINSGDYEYALKLGTASGGATAFSDGLAERKYIDELMETL